MNNYIPFKSAEIPLPGTLTLIVTTKAYEQMDATPSGVEGILKPLSSVRNIIITRNNKGSFVLHTERGVFICNPPDDHNGLLLMGFSENTLNMQNIALKYGIVFCCSGLLVKVALKSHYQFYVLEDGIKHATDRYRYTSSTAAVRCLCDEMQKSRYTADSSSSDEDLEEQPYEPSRKLSKLLAIAENYSILSSEMEKNNVNSVGRKSYKSIQPAQYERMDRLAYTLLTDSLDESMFKAGTQIDLEDREGVRHTAEILRIGKNSQGTQMTVLFSKQIDLSRFYTQGGGFTLSYSTINCDVQLDANEKIKSGECVAKYMDSVLGANQPSGFTQKSLNGLLSELKAKKYPPNQSQTNAIVSGIQTNDVFLVMGPPGTGKTTVILEWVKFFVLKEHKRVLVSSQNNKAVDNVLTRLAEEKRIDTIRIGSESKVQNDVRPFLFENKLNAKRQEIGDCTQRNLNELDQILSYWNQYYAILYQLFTEAYKVNEKRTTFRTFVVQQVQPVFQRLLSLAEGDREVKQRKQYLHAQITELYQKIADSRRSKNPFKKLSGWIKESSRSKKMRAFIAEYDTVCHQETQSVCEYNERMRQYHSLLHHAYTDLYSVYYESHAIWKRKCASVIRAKPAANNIWQLFSRITVDDQTLSQYVRFKNMLEIISAELKRAQLIRSAVGDWQAIATNRQNYALNEIILDSVNLVGATCIGINSQKRFADLRFDVTIIDEAGQIQIHNALVPMSVSNKLIMLGDHKQIPPSVDQELLDACAQNGITTEYLEKSLFEKLYEALPESNKIMLDTQYRMPAEIANTISNWFYDSRYYSPPFKKNLASPLPRISRKPFVVIDTSLEKSRYETRIPNAGSSNELEASVVYVIIDRILQQVPDLDPNEIGVISAYKSQVKLISSKLLSLMNKQQADEMVATLDSFQGQERDIILYSFTKSSNAPAQSKRIGFLNELRRLNVAMTRCKKMLILIGDMRFLSSCEHMDTDDFQQAVYEKSEKQFSDFIKRVLSDVKSGNGELIQYADFIARINFP